MDADDNRAAESGWYSAAELIELRVGGSRVVPTPRIPSAIWVTDPTVAVVGTLGTANKVVVQGLKVGTTDLWVQFGPDVPPLAWDVSVHRDVRLLERALDGLVDAAVPLEIGPDAPRVVADAEDRRLTVGEALVIDPCAGCSIDDVSASVEDPALATVGTAADGSIAVVARGVGSTWLTLRYGNTVIASQLVVSGVPPGR